MFERIVEISLQLMKHQYSQEKLSLYENYLILRQGYQNLMDYS